MDRISWSGKFGSDGHCRRSIKTIDVHVISGKTDGVLAGAKGQQQRTIEKQKNCSKRHRNQNLQGKTVTQDFFCLILIASPHSHRSPRGTTAADEGREGGYNHNDRHTNANASKCEIAASWHMTDIDAIH